MVACLRLVFVRDDVECHDEVMRRTRKWLMVVVAVK